MGPIDPHDAVPIRVLKTLLRSNIPNLRPRVQEAIDQAFYTCMNDGRSASDGMTDLVMKGQLLIGGNNLQGGSLSTPIISRRRSVFKSTTRSFSESALVSLRHGPRGFWSSSFDDCSGESRFLSGYSWVSPPSTICYAHISLLSSLDAQVRDHKVFVEALLTHPDSWSQDFWR